MPATLTVLQDTLQVAANLKSGTDWASFWATVIAAVLGALGIFGGVAYAQHRQLKNLLAAQRNEKVLERELDAIQDAYTVVLQLFSVWSTRPVRESFVEAEQYQFNIRFGRFYLPEEFVQMWREVFTKITSLDSLEEQGAPGSVEERRELRFSILLGLQDCRRILLRSQGRPTDEVVWECELRSESHVQEVADGLAVELRRRRTDVVGSK